VPTLATTGVGLAVLDRDSLAQLFAAGRRGSELSQTLLEKLVLGDGYGATSLRPGVGAFRPQRARSAGLDGKLDLGSEGDGLLFAGRAGDRAVAHVERECVFTEVLAVLGEPRTADDLAATRRAHPVYLIFALLLMLALSIAMFWPLIVRCHSL